MVTDLDLSEDACKWKFYFNVPEPFSVPTQLFCTGNAREEIVPWWCKIFQQLFGLEGRQLPGFGSNSCVPRLPTNVTIAISSNDKDDEPSAHGTATCLASASPNSTFAITNFLELQRMVDRTE
jgi:hypothetical protein